MKEFVVHNGNTEAIIVADWFEVNGNGNLLFFSIATGHPTDAFASGDWSEVHELKKEEK